MIEQLKSPNHVLALRASGKMTAEDVETIRRSLIDKIKQHDRLGLYFDIAELSDMSAGGLTSGVKADMEFLPQLGRLARYALVSDKEWPRAVAGMIGGFVPGLEIQVFGTSQRDEALQWVGAATEKREVTTPAVQSIPTDQADVFAFEMNGVISAEELPGILEQVNKFLEGRDKARMLNRIKHLGGIDPSIFMQSGLVSMKMAALQKVERYAIVGAPGWLRKVVEAINPLFPDIDMQTFPAEREDEAWRWVSAKPTK